MRLFGAYRGTGADLPFGDPRRSHPGVAMEGYFWRFTDVERGRSVIALIGVNQSAAGPWATVALAGSNGFLRVADVDDVRAVPVEARADGLGARAGSLFRGDDRRVVVELGDDARLDVVLHDLLPWASRALGGSSIFQAVPGLNQYWHPWLLGGQATGTAVIGGEEWVLTGARTYGEKNWGKEGFPDSWWWGQANGFAHPSACVAFAGGEVHAGPLRTTVTGLVVRLPDDLPHPLAGKAFRLGDPLVSPVHAEVGDDGWLLTGEGLGWRVDVEGTAPLADAHVLPVPLPSERRNVPGALEHLGGTMRVAVRRDGKRIWQGVSGLAGLEHGSLERAAGELARRA